jgi:hypothetical protein
MTTILTNARKGRAATLEELGEELRTRYGEGARIDVIQPQGRFAPMLALVTVPPSGHDVVENVLTREPAQLEWWQKNNHLLGVGFAYEQAEAADRALAMAGRGDFARRDVTVWFDRAWRKFRFFYRAWRDEDDHYKPTGREVRADDFALLTTEMS